MSFGEMHKNRRYATNRKKSTCAKFDWFVEYLWELHLKQCKLFAKFSTGTIFTFLQKKTGKMKVLKPGLLHTITIPYNNHSYVIQSVRSRTGYMQLQASEMERAAPALYKRQPVVTAIIHFDGTDLSFID